MTYPIKFTSIFKERLWGGNGLKNILHKETPPNMHKIGESWDICDRSSEQTIVENGAYKGFSLKDLRLNLKHKLLGTKLNPLLPFPVLVKILDAQEDLSLQVHPRTQDLKYLPIGASPKTEFWYVLEHKPNAKIMAGLANSDKGGFIDNLNKATISNFVNHYKSKKNLLMSIQSGEIHSIGGGNMILEIQQNSDTTYRLSDWGRLDEESKPRNLHIKEGLLCIDFFKRKPIPTQIVDTTKNYNLIDNELFSSRHNHVKKATQIATTEEFCEILSVTNGNLSITGGNSTLTLKRGESCILPAKMLFNIQPSKESTNLPANFLLTKPSPNLYP